MVDEQVRCKPMVLRNWEPVGVVTVHVTHVGRKIEEIVIAVAWEVLVRGRNWGLNAADLQCMLSKKLCRQLRASSC